MCGLPSPPILSTFCREDLTFKSHILSWIRQHLFCSVSPVNGRLIQSSKQNLWPFRNMCNYKGIILPLAEEQNLLLVGKCFQSCKAQETGQRQSRKTSPYKRSCLWNYDDVLADNDLLAQSILWIPVVHKLSCHNPYKSRRQQYYCCD